MLLPYNHTNPIFNQNYNRLESDSNPILSWTFECVIVQNYHDFSGKRVNDTKTLIYTLSIRKLLSLIF